MIVVIGTFRLPIERYEEAQPALKRVIAASRAEAGCLSYTYAEDVLEPGLFRVSEAWTSRAALTAHFATPHMLAWQAERAALGLSERDVRAYTVNGADVL